MTKDLTEGRPLPILFKFSLPIIGGNLFQLFYTLADTVIVGQTLGEKSLSAVGSTSIIIYFVLVFIQGMTNGFSILLAQVYGMKDKEGVKKSIATAIYLSLFVSIVLTIVTLSLSKSLLIWMKIPSEIEDEAYSYLFIVLAGTFTTVFYNMISNTLRALGDSKLPLIFLVLSSVLNVILDYVLIIFTPLGVGGAALATVASQLIATALCFIVAIRKYDEMKLERKDWKLDIKAIRSHLKLGTLMGLQMSVMCIGQLVMQSAVNSLGTVAIAGYTAASKVDQLGVLVDNAFISAIATYVSQNYGAGKHKRIREGIRASLIIVESTALVMILSIFLLMPYIARLFLNDPQPDVYRYIEEYFMIVLPFYPLLGLLCIYRTADQSMNITWAPLVACIIELLSRCTAAIALKSIIGYKGIMLSHPLAWLGAVLVTLPAYYVYVNRYQKTHPSSL